MTDTLQHNSIEIQVAAFSLEKRFDSIISIQSKELKTLDSLVATLQQNDGEKFLNKFTYDTVFTVLVTISIFFIGIVVDRIIKYYDKCVQAKDLNKYFKYYLDKIADKITPRLIELYRKTYTETNIDTGISTNSPRVLTGHFERIKNIDNKELFNSINQSEELSSILSSVDFINKLTIEVEDYHSMVRKEDDIMRKELDLKMSHYFSKLAEYIEHLNLNNPQYQHRDEFRELVNNSILLYYQQIAKTRQFKRTYKQIIRSIQNKVVETNIFRVDPKAKEIAEIGKDVSYRYYKLKRVTTEFRIQYRAFNRALNDTLIKLREERDKITCC